jgi:hypothetical protein
LPLLKVVETRIPYAEGPTRGGGCATNFIHRRSHRASDGSNDLVRQIRSWILGRSSTLKRETVVWDPKRMDSRRGSYPATSYLASISPSIGLESL